MNSKLWIKKALSACLSISLLATCSAVALANSAKVAGELTVAGNGVLVNGESAQSGRSVFSSSTVTTPDNAGAIVGFGKLGKIEIAPNSIFALSFDEKGISGNLTSGKITVLGAASPVNVTTLNGTIVSLTSGESVMATAAKQDKDDDGHGGAAWWGFAAVMVAAGALIIYAATNDNDRIALGGGGTVVSPSR
jgi:hypothetical protein